jgi:hypothetical protein
LLDREALKHNHHIDSSPENSVPTNIPRLFGKIVTRFGAYQRDYPPSSMERLVH